MRNDFEAVLFDLDGTLVDTALDMVGVLFDMIEAYGRPGMPYDLVRTHVSNGSLALVRLAFPDASKEQQVELQNEYLSRYEQSVCGESALFSGLADLIDILDKHGYPWGIVTNKPQRLTDRLLDYLNLSGRAGCAICGDTIAEKKPHPAPLLLASTQLGVAPEKTIYVGDAQRDVDAGHAAGMKTVAVTYGYITADDNPMLWRADEMASDTKELTKILLKAVNLAA